jgi:lipid II:glycine glycyltransferase (peptidoglycan interpeptide bridge formation enzyme)
VIIIRDSIDREKWEDFVLSHPHGNIFQSSYIADVYRATKNYEPVSLAAVDSNDNDKILAVLLAVLKKDAAGIVGSISARSIINGGPLFVEGEKGLEALETLFIYYEKFLNNRAIYTQIRNFWDTESSKYDFSSLGYEYEPELNYLINLNRPAEEIWGDIQKSRKNGIKKAEKIGIKVQRIKARKEIKDCYNVMEENYKKINLPLVDISLLESAYDKLLDKGHVDFFIANLDGEVVGSTIVLRYMGMVYGWHIGSKQGVNHVNEALYWHVMSEYAGKEKVFDLGGAGHPDIPYGVREFKQKFGGQEVNYGLYKKTHNKTREEIMKSGLKIYKTFGKYVKIHV